MNPVFVGSALCEVDGDGRLVLPDFIRDVLGTPAAECALFLSRHESDACLIGYGDRHLRTLRRRTERRRRADESAGRGTRGHHRRARATFGLVEPTPQRAGTMYLSAAMRHLGRIDRLALLVGAGESFEIWNPQLAAGSEDLAFRELAEFRLREHESASIISKGDQQ